MLMRLRFKSLISAGTVAPVPDRSALDVFSEHMMARILLTASLVVLVSASTARPAEPFDAAGFESFVEQARAAYEVPGCAVAVVENDQVVFLKGFGLRELGKPEPVDPDTLFMLASVSKTFTAALAGTFVDEGQIGWDTPVVDHLTEMQLFDNYATRHASLRDFLAHRSGLPAFTGDLLGKLGYPRAEILRRLRYLEPGCSFRERAGYSNPGFLIAGMTTERLGEKTWEELVEERLLTPLKMSRSGTSLTDWQRTDNYASNHMLVDGALQPVVWESHDPMGPAGGVTSTARDMAQWLRLHLGEGQVDGRRILSEEAIAEMHTPAMVETPSFAEAPPIDARSGFSYGPGWGIYHYNGHQIVEKGGARAGLRTVAMLIPDAEVGVVVLANRNLTYLPEAIRAWVLEAYAGRADHDLQAAIREAADATDKLFDVASGPAAPSDHESSVPLESFAGTYRNDLYGELRILHEEDALRWEAGPANFGGRMTHVAFDNFALAFPQANILLPEPATFTIGETGVPTKLITETYGTFERVPESQAETGNGES